MEGTSKTETQQELSKSVLSRYFNEQTEEALDYEIERWEPSSNDSYDDEEEDEESEDEELIFESVKEVVKLIRDAHIRKLNLQERPTVVQTRTPTGRAKHGTLFKVFKRQISVCRKGVNRHRISLCDFNYKFGAVLPRKKIKAVSYVTKKKRKCRTVKNFIVVKNEICGKPENLRFDVHQWNHFVVPFGSEVFATLLRLVEEKIEGSSVKSCGEVSADALDCDERLVRDLRITLVKIESDGTLERLLDGICLTDFMFNKCQHKDCTCQHHLEGQFGQRLSAVDSFDSLKIAYQFVKKCYAFRYAYSSFIKAMARLTARHFMAKNVIEDIRQQFVIKHFVGIRKVILGLVSTGLQFHEAVHFVMQENDIADIELSDVLLRIIALHHNLPENWFLVRLLVEKRDKLPQEIAQSLIELCIMQPVINAELARNVMKELIVDRNLTEANEIPSHIYSELLILACDEHGHVP